VRCFADNAEPLDTVPPDAAIIATPNAMHVPAGLACAARGAAHARGAAGRDTGRGIGPHGDFRMNAAPAPRAGRPIANQE
jgi:hypothetical protein